MFRMDVCLGAFQKGYSLRQNLHLRHNHGTAMVFSKLDSWDVKGTHNIFLQDFVESHVCVGSDDLN